MVGVGGLEPPTPASQTQCAANCATPRTFKSIIGKREKRKENKPVAGRFGFANRPATGRRENHIWGNAGDCPPEVLAKEYMKNQWVAWVLLALLSFWAAGCQEAAANAPLAETAPTRARFTFLTITPGRIRLASRTPSPGPRTASSAAPTETPSPTFTLTFTLTFTPTASPTFTPTASPQPTLPTSTPAPSATVQPTQTPSAIPFVCGQSQGRVERFKAAAPGEAAPDAPPLTVRIYTPPCYAQHAEDRYPVLYILHGQSFGDDQWDRLGMDESADALISSGQVSPFLIVMPLEQYTLLDPFETQYGAAVADQLVPWVDAHYQTCPERACRAIGGLSRGGGWAIHTGFTRWQVFGAIGAHSAPVFVNDPYRLPGWLEEIPRDEMPRFYMDHGRLDWYLKVEREFEALLVRLEVPHEYYVFEGAHDEKYWASHVEDYLRWYTKPWNGNDK